MFVISLFNLSHQEKSSETDKQITVPTAQLAYQMANKKC